MTGKSSQPDFNFSNATGSHDGHAFWRKQRADSMREIGRRVGLPIGRRVELWLAGEIRLEGTLLLKDSAWFPETVNSKDIELAIGNVPFKQSEITSCFRLD